MRNFALNLDQGDNQISEALRKLRFLNNRFTEENCDRDLSEFGNFSLELSGFLGIS